MKQTDEGRGAGVGQDVSQGDGVKETNDIYIYICMYVCMYVCMS